MSLLDVLNNIVRKRNRLDPSMLNPVVKGQRARMVHDYTQRYWGHSFEIMDWDENGSVHMMGWGMGLQKGDSMKWETTDHRIVEYRIKQIEYYRDPPDMWKADLVKVT